MLPNFIIGGTNKAGTTSLFRYLSDHPEVCGSRVKETGFFLHEITGDQAKDRLHLGRYFDHCRSGCPIVMEASTAYLAHAGSVIPAIIGLLDAPKMMFMLRAPAERLYSYYNFHVGKLSIPSTVSFEHYVNMCMKFDAGRMDAQQAPFEARHLDALRFGNYAGHLKLYLEHFPRGNIKIALFDELQSDPKQFMLTVSDFLGIDKRFYETYQFSKSNATFSSRNEHLHRLAVFMNRKLEHVLRQKPALKAAVVRMYKKFNMAKLGYSSMPLDIRVKLLRYYEPDMLQLEKVLGSALPGTWR